MHTIASLLNRIGRLEAERAAIGTRLPAWAQEHQGRLMANVMLRKLGARVAQAHNADWFEPAEMPTEATRAMGKLALSLLKTNSYAEAYSVAREALDRLPPYRYAPRTTEELPS
jgi:hypothetical protein